MRYHPTRLTDRRSVAPGFTVVELLVALLVFGIVMTAGLSFLQVQTRSFRIGLDNMSTLQTLRYAVGTLEEDIQTAGTHVASGQPEIVHAGTDVLVFNADYATRTADDPFAVFYDPDLEDRQVRSWDKTASATLPRSSFSYPDSNYWEAVGVPSAAETLILFFASDTATDRSDDYALYRQVNAEPPQLVARNILATPGHPFFRYYRDSETGVDSIPDGDLPISHTVPLHGSAADTGAVALVDSIRAVRVTLSATNGAPGDRERTAMLSRIIRMPNMGFAALETCGSRPILGVSPSVNVVTLSGGEPAVDLSWGQSTDEDGGEDDVVRYVLFRREAPSTDWGEPYLSIPAGQNSYSYQDANVTPGTTYQYALAVQDCTPTLSRMSGAVDAIIP